jgi:ferredoxin
MPYKIDAKNCLRCGLCISNCPEGAIIADETVVENDGLILYTTRIDPAKCTECGTCVSYEWWCPAQAIFSL